MKKFLFLISALMLMVFVVSCKDEGFKKTETGLVYKFHEKNRGPKPEIDNIVNIHFAYRYPEDSVFYSSDMAGPAGYITLEPSGYPGDIYEALRMMSKGDSATFKFGANSFFTITANSPMVPPFIQPDDSIFVDIALYDFFNEEEYKEHMDKEREKMAQEQEVLSKNEADAIEKYLKDNNIDATPNESGLVVIVNEEGTGPVATAGQTIKFHYTGKLLDGTPFDSSYDRGEPLELTLGVGQVIPGMDEGLSQLKQGSKATLIIPSKLAYGPSDMGVIKPNSTLVFDVEVVEVK